MPRRDVQAATYKRRRAVPEVRIYRMWNNAQQRARRSGAEFNLSLEWVTDKIAQGCAVTGLPFDLTVADGSGGGNPWGPSIDRKDSTKGYTEENSQVTVWIYNRAKNKNRHQDVLRLCHALINPQMDT